MDRINPIDLFRLLHRRQIKIHHDRFLIASDHYAHKGFIRIGVDLLVGHERRHVNKIARPGFGKELNWSPQRILALPLTT